MAILQARGALTMSSQAADAAVPGAVAQPSKTLVVLLEPERPGSAQELLGAAAQIAARVSGRVVAIQADSTTSPGPAELSAWGADHLVLLQQAAVAEDVARGVSTWADTHQPWAILAPSTSWGREVASRVAARLEAGLTGDAIELDVNADRLVGWKPAFGGRLVAAIRATSPVQMVTVRPGVLPRLASRPAAPLPVETLTVTPQTRLRVLSHRQNDQLDALALARRVVGVGFGIDPTRYGELDPLLQTLQAELATTRKVTDKDWLPHSRQVGITGRSIAPNLYIALAIGGRFNHTCGIQGAGTVLAINTDASAPIFDCADIGIVADWAECVPLLVDAFARVQQS
jgi:electron transfer flavoprotein alpha subunit